MNKLLIPIIVVGIIVVLVGGYLGRHKIKALLGMSSAPAATETTPTSVATNSASPTNNIYMTKTDPTKGNYMTDFDGKTLYTFDNDTKGISTCTGGCAKIWPAYTSGAVDQGTFPTNITAITRSDGSKQFAWKDMPLYYYSGDTKAGDLNGDGIQNIWHIVKL